MAEMRLQRYLSQSGLASRRKCEDLITAGRVSVNGRVVHELGTKVDAESDRVTVDGRRVMPQNHLWVVLHKPPGTICSTADPEGRETVLDLVRIPNVRLYPVGRLDYQTSGVLLLTNDGTLAEQLLHPRHEIPRTYHVKVKGIVSVPEIERLREGVVLDNGRKATCEVVMLASTGLHTWIEMTIKQGINHQIHHMLAAIEREVLRLIRVEFAGIRADTLPAGKWRSLTQREINELRTRFGLVGETRRDPENTGRRQPRSRGDAKADRPVSRKPSSKTASRRAGSKRAEAQQAEARRAEAKRAEPRRAAAKPAARKAAPAGKPAPRQKPAPARKPAPAAGGRTSAKAPAAKAPGKRARPATTPGKRARPATAPGKRARPATAPGKRARPAAKPPSPRGKRRDPQER